jgi:hypothetical protein
MGANQQRQTGATTVFGQTADAVTQDISAALRTAAEQNPEIQSTILLDQQIDALRLNLLRASDARAQMALIRQFDTSPRP